MTRTLRSLVLAAALLTATNARAGEHRAFALIVTNNHSFDLGRPDLQYADDDGAKYYETFAAIAQPADVRLLTDFDRDTARLFPALIPIAKPPSKHAVQAAASELAAAIAEANHAGASTDLYFVYAGHGDVDGGRGFVELIDARLYAEDLEALLATMPATRIHVILDSCNSFFVINARKPGGHRFATPTDATDGLTRHLPNVGVFLSTSAEAEVYEWSELQSGVFSHAVRSGLAGAADADGDGVVTYDELRAFVDTATANVRNAAFKPKVYARGPGGDDRERLFAVAGPVVRVTGVAGHRQTFRDRDELPWVDVFAEPGATVAIHLPPNLGEATIDDLEVSAKGARVVSRSAVHVDAGEVVASVERRAGTSQDPRGASDVFRMLFTAPFGPSTLAAYDAERDQAPPPVFGVSQEDAARMERMLDEIDASNRADRIKGGEIALVGAAAMAGVGAAATLPEAARIAYGAGAVGVAVVGVVTLLRRGPYEHLREDLVRGLARRDAARAVADTDKRLHELAEQHRRGRTLGMEIGAGIVGVAAANAIITRLSPTFTAPEKSTFYAIDAMTAIVGAATVVNSQFETPIERSIRLWDGEAHAPQIVIAPVTGGATAGITGHF